MPSLVPSVEAVVSRLWNKFQSELPRLGGVLRPAAASDVFTYGEDENGVHVNAQQACFSIKERATLSTTQLYVALQGIITFKPTSTRDNFRTGEFKTRAGYFREVEPKRLVHVYGVHYDRDDVGVAHPVFHSQMKSMSKLYEIVNSSYHRHFEPIDGPDDLVGGILPNVRIPSAYMDLFSAMLQIVGDHLLYKDSGANHMGSFQSLRKSVGQFRSAMSASPRLQAVLDEECFRGGHWYS